MIFLFFIDINIYQILNCFYSYFLLKYDYLLQKFCQNFISTIVPLIFYKNSIFIILKNLPNFELSLLFIFYENFSYTKNVLNLGFFLH